MKGSLVLIILDGWGHRDDKHNNGIEMAEKPFFDSLIKNYPHTLIDGSGPAVGLPNGVMGNSEVGHMNLGAGRIVYSGLSQIYHAIEDGSFVKNEAFLKAIEQVKKANSTLHLMGLVSDGAVHSHQDHLYSLLKLAKQNDVKSVAVHCFLDGRDTSPTDGIKYLKALQQQMDEIGIGWIASLSGRYFAMDRDKRWERVAKAFQVICGKSKNHTGDCLQYLEDSYAKGIGDEFVEPVVVTDKQGAVASVTKNDAMIFFNFRADRAREISHAFVDKDFKDFERGDFVLPAVFVCTALYEKNIPALVAFNPMYPEKIFPEILADNKIPQLRIAETEKYAHVTFFFNGGRDTVFEQEDRVLIPSPREVSTYDKKPEMSALLVKDELKKCLELKKYGVVICNFANADMVGHTAKPDAIVKAIGTIDHCLSKIVPLVLKQKGAVIITADHGNAEQMLDDKGEPLTAHTTNLVPFILVSDVLKNARLKSGGRLCDVAPTMLHILKLPQPKEMTGVNLIL